MPVIMCKWCHYLGQGKNMWEQYDDVIKHEADCEERIALGEEE